MTTAVALRKQELMLAGVCVDWGVWVGLTLIVIISFGLVLLIMRRQYKKTCHFEQSEKSLKASIA